MTSRLNTLSQGRVVLCFAALYLIGQLGMTWIVRDLGPELVQLQLTTSWEHFQALQSGWSETQWAQYHRHFAPDFVFPWIYGAFLFCWMLRHTRHSPRWIQWGWALPGLASLADCVENAIHLHLLTAPVHPDLWVLATGWISRFKWGCAATLIVVFTILEARRLILSSRQ